MASRLRLRPNLDLAPNVHGKRYYFNNREPTEATEPSIRLTSLRTTVFETVSVLK